jgi:hypothetical protein
VWVRFGSNAFANVLTGISAIVFQLGLTAMASRNFDPEAFSVWTLALSMASLTPLFAVNLSAIVTRQLVPGRTGNGDDVTAVVMTAARRLGRALAALAVLTILLASLGLHQSSPNLATTGGGTFLLAVLLLTLGQIWQISIQPTQGWHYAREQNWPVAGAFLIVRASGLIAMWAATRNLADNLLGTALCLALGNWVGVALSYLRFFRPTTKSCDAGPGLTRQLFETAHLMRWFAVWSIGMATIQYGLPQLMSILGAAHYNAFYLAYSLNLALSGAVAAIGSAMLAPVARLGASGDRYAIVQALTYLPILIALFLVIALVVLQLAMPLLVTHWSHGIAAARDVSVYLVLLGFQTIARALSVVFAMVLASRATALRLVGPALLEVGSVLFIAFPLGRFFGEQAFLLALAAAGLIGALATVVVGISVAGLEHADRRRILVRFVLTETAALLACWMLAR